MKSMPNRRRTAPFPGAPFLSKPLAMAFGALASPAMAQDLARSVTAAATLPRDLSPWGMFMAADIVVKAVMIGLVLASVLSWTVWFAKTIELAAARRRLRAVAADIAKARTLDDCIDAFHGRGDGAAMLVREAAAEFALSDGGFERDGVKERVASRLARIESAAARSIARGTGLLATIGATAPFVGLFGTVWGIMNSFIGISKQQTTNLAVVAPGIAEALLATALGLVAAIPAVVMYNLFARAIAGYRTQFGDVAAQVERLVSRDLDRRRHGGARPRAAAE